MKHIFPVEVDTFSITDQNFLNQIADHIVNLRDTTAEPKPFSIRGETSFHSKDDLANLKFDWSKQLHSLIFALTENYHKQLSNTDPSDVLDASKCQIACWGMLMGSGDFSTVHCHPGADYCGTMWIKVPEAITNHPSTPDPSPGALCLSDPVVQRRAVGKSTYTLDIKPAEGHGILFPHWLDHSVEPFYGEGERISIAWNFYKKRL